MDSKREKARRNARDVRLVAAGLLMESVLGLDRWWAWAIVVAVCTVICIDWTEVTWKFWRLEWISVTFGFTEVPTNTNRATTTKHSLRRGKRAYVAFPLGEVPRLYFIELDDEYRIQFPGSPLWREEVSDGVRRYTFPAVASADDPTASVDMVIVRAKK